jgi:DNA-binding ferritin-like protein (oxidative damage protectant)
VANKNATVRSFTTSVDIPGDSRKKINRILNQHLADSFDLMSQVKQAHWNVKGSDFWQLHKLFDEVAERPRNGSMSLRSA